MSFLTDLVYGPAMEAEDITADATNAASDVTGGDNVGDDNKDIDLNTDDILGVNEPDNNNNDDDSSGDPSADEGDPTNPDEGDGGDSDPSSTDPSTPEEQAPEEKDSDDEFTRMRKYKLWKNFRSFYKILDDAIDLVAKYIPNISDAKTILVMDNIKEGLQNAKAECYDIMTNQYQTITYPQLQKKYISLNHVYDLISKELEVYFDEFREKFH